MTQVVSEDGAAPGVAAGLEHFRALAERLPELVWAARADGSWEYVNARWEELVGAPRSAALGLGWRDYVHPDDLSRWPAESAAAGLAVRFRGPAGVRRVRVSLERGSGGSGWIGIGTPVPEPCAAGPSAPFERRVVDSLFAFVAVLEPDGTIVDVNRAPLEAAGARIEDVRGLKFWEGPWGDPTGAVNARVRAACERAARGELVRYDEQLRAPDGSIATLDLQIAPVRDAAGRVTHLVPTATDITPRKRVENALRESEARFQVAAEIAGLIAAQSDVDLRYRWIHSPHPDFTVASILGKTDVEVEDCEGARTLLALKQQVLETRRGTRAEVAFQRSDGERVYDVALEPIFDRQGAITGVTTAAVDATEHRRIEQALRASEERYRTLFESIDEGFCIVQLVPAERGEAVDLRFVETNAAFERHSGLRDAQGKTLREAAPGSDAAWPRVFDQVARERRPTRFEHHEPALERWFDIYACPLGDPSLRQVAIVFSDVTERRRAEAALRRSEELALRAAGEAQRERYLLDAVLEAAPVGIIVAEASGRIVRVNAANERLWGPSPSSQSIAEYAEWKGWWADGSERHGRRLGPHEWAMARALRGEVSPGDLVEIEPFDAPGLRRTIINSGAPVRDSSGRVVGAVVAQMDISERVAAEDLVRRSEERFRLVARATNDVVWDWDLESGHLEWNDTVLQHFGLTREELGDRIEGWDERIHPEDRERVSAKIYAALEGDAESWSDEYRFRKKDGSYAVFLDRGHIARDASGKAYRMIGSMLDITEQRRVEAALRESEGRFRALADNVSQLVWIADEKGNLLWANKRWCEYLGVSPDDVQDVSFEVALHPDHAQRVREGFARHLESGTEWEDTFPARRHDGVYRWFLTRANPIRDEAGQVVRWFGTNTDVTEQREAQEALRDADRRKDEFLAMLAHELRNPLAPVRNAVEMLRMIGGREPTLDRLRDVIDRQVTHMARLIDDLLDVSRVARGRIQLRRERHDLTQIVKQTVDDYRESLESAGLTLTLDVDRGPLWVDGDGTRLAQIVGNLLHNAGKFTERGGRISVRVGADDAEGRALVEVEDDGIGMEPAMLARLFDPFTQAAQGLDRSKGGLGLGLALAKALVELHGGTITASSEGLGRGSRFVVRLPLAEPALARPTRGAKPRAAGTGLRVLVIEDNQDAAETLQMLLELAGHDAEVAYDGRTGIDAARAKRRDVVICDIGLPGSVDGYAVARALRADPGATPSLLVALSGYSQEEDRRLARDAGFDVHLAKPADFETLRTVLATVRPSS